MLEEFGSDYFEDFRPSSYMAMAFRVRPGAIRDIPAAVHVDGTCRAQSVSRALNPRFHSLIARFHEMAGVSMILNTSFNRHGLPMVATPRQALQHLAEGCVDMLVLESFVVDGDPRGNSREVEDEANLSTLFILRRAATLVSAGHLSSARRLVERVGVPVAITDREFVLDDGRAWDYTRPTAELDVVVDVQRAKVPSEVCRP